MRLSANKITVRTSKAYLTYRWCASEHDVRLLYFDLVHERHVEDEVVHALAVKDDKANAGRGRSLDNVGSTLNVKSVPLR
jgi:hypothetical protein